MRVTNAQPMQRIAHARESRQVPVLAALHSHSEQHDALVFGTAGKERSPGFFQSLFMRAGSRTSSARPLIDAWRRSEESTMATAESFWISSTFPESMAVANHSGARRIQQR